MASSLARAARNKRGSDGVVGCAAESPRKIRSTTTMEDRQKIRQESGNGTTNAELARRYDLSRSGITRILQDNRKQQDELRLANGMSEKMKRPRVVDGLGAPLKKWIDYMRGNFATFQVGVSKQMIFAEAQYLSQHMLNQSDFNPTDTWFENFLKRFGLRYTRLHGEAGGVEDSEDALLSMNKLREVIAQFKPSQVYNMDETGLFYASLPNGTYFDVTKEEKKSMRGAESFTCKDRVSILAKDCKLWLID